MRKALFTIAILSVLVSACSLEGRKNGETTTDSTSVDSTQVDSIQVDTTVVDSVQP